MNEKQLPFQECCRANSSCPLAVLKDEEIREIEPMIGTITRPSGSIIFEEGDSALDAYIICRGEVEQIRRMARGGNHLLLTRRQGDLLGVEELLAKASTYGSTARVLQDAMVRVIPRAEFLNLVQTSSVFCLEVMKRLAFQALTLEQKLTQFVELPACRRLVEALATLAERYGKRQGEFVEIQIPITNQHLAERVGVTPETLSALLGTLKEKGLVRRKGRRFLVRDPKKLTNTR
jgi:CRP-like cAMP-binding protein